MVIPPKKSGMKSKYKWERLLKNGQQYFVADKATCLLLKTNAYYMARKHGIRVTTRLSEKGITIYILSPVVGADAQEIQA